MFLHKYRLLATVLLFYTSSIQLLAQTIPGPPPVPTAPAIPGAAAPATIGAPTAAAQPRNLWSFLLPTEEQCEKCKKKYCNSIFPTIFQAILKQVFLYSGGLIKPLCPTPDQAKPEDLAKPADSVDGAAARIKADEAEAKARRANVRYLATVDCSRYPEAEKAIINALRTDRNECVRLEAAMGLGTGCCCTQKTIEALKLTATASDKDGNPIETSERVKAAATYALSLCEARVPFEPEPPERPEIPGLPPPPPGMVKRPEPPLLRPVPQAPVQPALFERAPSLPPFTLKTMSSPPRPAGVQQTAYLEPVQNPFGEPPVEAAANPTGQRGLFDVFSRTMMNGRK